MRINNREILRTTFQTIRDNKDRLAFYFAFVSFLTVFVLLLLNIGALRTSPFLATVGFGLMGVFAATLQPLAKRAKANENNGPAASTNQFKSVELSISDSGLDIGGQHFRADELRKIFFNGNLEGKTLDLTFEKTYGNFRDRMMYLCHSVRVNGSRQTFKTIGDMYDFMKTRFPMATDGSNLDLEKN